MSEDIVDALRNVYQRRTDTSGGTDVMIEMLRGELDEARRMKRHKIAALVGLALGVATAATTGHLEAALIIPSITTGLSILKR